MSNFIYGIFIYVLILFEFKQFVSNFFLLKIILFIILSFNANLINKYYE